jgi:hypothetical protein
MKFVIGIAKQMLQVSESFFIPPAPMFTRDKADDITRS